MPRSGAPRIVMGEHSPYRAWIGVALILICAVGVGLFALDYLQASADHRHQQSLREREALEDRIVELQRLNTQSKERIAALEREREMDREAEGQLRQDYAAQLAELDRLRKRIVFYDSVVSPQDGRSGLRLHSFHLQPIGARAYHYELILSQVSTRYRLVKGVVSLRIEGAADGAAKSLDWAEIGDREESGIPYEFKYFQDFRGVLKLPEGFTPRDVSVTLTPTGKRKAETFRHVWPGEA